ncbi:hypothetical protein FA95DRAFT_1561967 [Auriscalpium vulgare]|uniref:Uncharacterized protein n=1 Tax=Auriscalpium vulgare TaxID=40419 RepID=A0ACB8RKX0_9AGAM|nr:hypothetical protein FA95DRAFT_1561967 [Auriscalpium vulgare]
MDDPYADSDDQQEGFTEGRLRRAEPSRLDVGERWWVRRYVALEQAGYILRPRYHPNWKPSWSGKWNWRVRTFCEDSLPNQWRWGVIDATRKSDGAQVVLKKIHFYDEREIEMYKFFTSEPVASDPRNHSLVPYETLYLPGVPEPILVMPLMRPVYSPPFQTFGEVVPFLSQIFEGIQLMHECHIAHRDCTLYNFVMDAPSMYPNGFHAMKINLNQDWTGEARHLTRTEARPRYYLIDYGISVRLPPEDGPPLILPVPGGDKSVPEFRHLDVPSNPFPIDVFYLGSMIRQYFSSKYHGFGFLEALVDDMTQEDPSKRPTMGEVVSRFTAIRSALGSRKLRGRLVGRREFILFRFIRDISHSYRTAVYMLRGLPAMADP